MSPTPRKDRQRIQAEAPGENRRPRTRAYVKQQNKPPPNSSSCKPSGDLLPTAARSPEVDKLVLPVVDQNLSKSPVNTNDKSPEHSRVRQETRSHSRNTEKKDPSPVSPTKSSFNFSPTAVTKTVQPALEEPAPSAADERHRNSEAPSAGLTGQPLLLSSAPYSPSRRRKSATTKVHWSKRARKKHQIETQSRSERKPLDSIKVDSKRKPFDDRTSPLLDHEGGTFGHLHQRARGRIFDWLSKISTDDQSVHLSHPQDIALSISVPSQHTHSEQDSSTPGTDTSSESEFVIVEEKSTKTGTTDAMVKPKRINTRQLSNLIIHYYIDLEDTGSDPMLKQCDLLDKLDNTIHTMDIESLQSYYSVLKQHSESIKTYIDASGFSGTDAFSKYESSQSDLIRWIPLNVEHRRWPGVIEVEFQLDRDHCSTSNEADFQKTQLMALIDRHDFRDHFAFSSGETWHIAKKYRLQPNLPTDRNLPSTKPDMIICFKSKAMGGHRWLRYDFPEHLRSCLYPRKEYTGNFTPFLIIEVKKSGDRRNEAFLKNLITASQALSNIYQLTKHYPDLEKQFFEKVRVFSLDVNAFDITLRVHRASRIANGSGKLEYLHCELKALRDYKRLEACHLVKTVLLDYALKTLLPIIQDVYTRLCQEKPSTVAAPVSNQGTKRKNNNSETVVADNTVPPLAPNNDSTDDGNQTSQGTTLTESFTRKADIQDTQLPESSRKKTRITKAGS